MICQVSYPVSDIIPLRLIMTSESHEALELVAVPHAIDVRLYKDMAFGKDAQVIRPFSRSNRSSYHRAELIAAASWELDQPDGLPRELPKDNVHSCPRWRIRLNGQFRRTADVEMVATIQAPDMAIRVCRHNFGRDLAPTDVSHSTWRASTHSVRKTSNLRRPATRKCRFLWVAFHSRHNAMDSCAVRLCIYSPR
jgi:hypothetical protein